MDVTVAPAKRQHVDGICRVCAEGWRETYADLLLDDEIGKSFYQKHGFETVGEREAYGDASDRNSLRLKRSL